MKVFIIWLFGVILWNFGYPVASPLEDVIAALILSFIACLDSVKSIGMILSLTASACLNTL